MASGKVNTVRAECSCGLLLWSIWAVGVTVSWNVCLLLEAVGSGELKSPAFCLQLRHLLVELCMSLPLLSWLYSLLTGRVYCPFHSVEQNMLSGRKLPNSHLEYFIQCCHFFTPTQHTNSIAFFFFNFKKGGVCFHPYGFSARESMFQIISWLFTLFCQELNPTDKTHWPQDSA